MEPMSILLIDVNRVSLDTSVDMLEYPLGLVYVASTLKQFFKDRVRIKIVSYDDRHREEQLERVGRLVEDFKPAIVGLRSLTMGREPLHKIATLVKEKFHVPLVTAGGPYATDSPEDVLSNDNIDCAVLGEGEQTAVELAANFLANKSLHSVKGLALKSSGGIRRTPPRPLLMDLDQLPFPDYGLVDFQGINRGHVDFSFRTNIPHANLFTSRGCPFKCIYCHNVFGKKFRAHSPERIMTEIRKLSDDYGITQFQVIEDIFNFDRQRAMKFFEMVVRSGLRVGFSFPNGIRGDMVEKEMVDAMWEAGVRYIAYAVETGSPRIQKLIHKNLNLERIAEAISLTTKKGIVTRGFFMIGFPTETEEEAMMTTNFAKSSDLTQALFFTVVYFPGTPLYRMAQQMPGVSDYRLNIEDDYVRMREGPYYFSKETLEELKLKAIREFFFSSKRLELSFDTLPNFYNQRDIDASMMVNIISGKMEEKDIKDPDQAARLHRYFIMVDRFSKKSGFYV
jgi:anaerobic magnesium-protoporphyrin IX monomethyl ester cyclase